MNVRDSEFVKGIMLADGFAQAKTAKDADVVLFNSCSVREHAEERLFGNIGELKELKKKRPRLIIGVMGCAAQNHKEKIVERFPIVDFVCGPGNENDIPGIARDVIINRCSIIAADKVDEKRPEAFPEYRDSFFKAYVSIGEGCDNFCSYCIVPYVRGRERSRNKKDILKEATGLANRGFKEITLLGQNVNSYKNFIKLLTEINKVKGIERIRFMTSHPKDASTELFKAMRDLDKVCEHLHLPVQSGSDRTLKLMNRRYTRAKYLKLMDSYRKILPEGSTTTDIIVGFPGESEADFDKTLDLLKKVRFDGAFTFKYSPRPPARSAALKDDVSKEEKEARLKKANDIQMKISEDLNRKLEGAVVEALVDGSAGNTPSGLTGRTRTNKIVVFCGKKNLIGKIVSVKVRSVTPYSLKGELYAR